MELIRQGVTQCGYGEAKVYIQVTRGAAPRDHVWSESLTPTVVITFRELVSPPADYYSQGVGVITVADHRWQRCDIKAIGLLANVLAKQEARKAAAFEALFVRDGYVLEGATSNVVAVRDASLITPPESSLLLSGITRMVVLELAREAGVPVRETSFTEEELCQADELFLTGTTIEIMPVTRVNDRRIGPRSPGPITTEFMGRFRKLHA
jgi:D-alanine transaminase